MFFVWFSFSLFANLWFSQLREFGRVKLHNAMCYPWSITSSFSQSIMIQLFSPLKHLLVGHVGPQCHTLHPLHTPHSNTPHSPRLPTRLDAYGGAQALPVPLTREDATDQGLDSAGGLVPLADQATAMDEASDHLAERCWMGRWSDFLGDWL